MKKPSATQRRFLLSVAKGIGVNNKGCFPWREKARPYPTFVAEFLLQRTGAAQATSVFEKVLSLYPDLNSLCEARREDVLAVLFPLGLQHRNRAFCQAIGELADRKPRTIPSSYEVLIGLHGVGRYTASAVLCFGFGKRIGLIDPNIVRVYERYFGLSSVKARKHTDDALWTFSDALVQDSVGSPRYTNWGLLDIGRTVCKKKPLCDVCPLASKCAHSREQQ